MKARKSFMKLTQQVKKSQADLEGWLSSNKAKEEEEDKEEQKQKEKKLQEEEEELKKAILNTIEFIRKRKSSSETQLKISSVGSEEEEGGEDSNEDDEDEESDAEESYKEDDDDNFNVQIKAMAKDDDKGPGCSVTVATVWLVLFNMIFAVLGIGITVLGFLLRFKSTFFETYVLDLLTATEVEGVNLKSIIESVAIVVILVGFIVAGVGLMGIIGACCKVKCLLVIYFLLMLKLLIIEVVLVVAFVAFRDKIDSRVKNALQTTLDTYKGYNSQEPVTVGWNYVFYQFECCGIDGYGDLATAADWPKNITYSGVNVLLTAPLFCCKVTGSFPDIDLPSDAQCASSPSSTTSNYQTGCYQAVEDYILGYRIALIVIVSVVIVCQLQTFAIVSGEI